jgi:hypothetical protein
MQQYKMSDVISFIESENLSKVRKYGESGFIKQCGESQECGNL